MSTVEKLSPFDIANNINSKTGFLLNVQEAGYNAFVINKIFSNTQDSVFFANEMNCNWSLALEMQYAFYYHGLSKKKRFGKWNKNQDNMEEIALIQEAYDYSYHRAKEALPLLRPHLDAIRAQMDKGGRHGTKQ